MRIHPSLIAAVFTCALAALVSCSDDGVVDHTSGLSNRLSGSWTCVKLWESGREVSDKIEIRFQGDAVTGTVCGSTVTGNYRVVSGSGPAAIDLVFTEDGKETRIPAIVEIKGSTLRMCHPDGKGGTRPLRFEP